MARVDVSALKEQALRAVEKSAWAKAAELYLQIARHEPDADWRQRAGEALRKAGDPAGAAGQFMAAAEGYAQGGFLLKAIAVCKVVLQIDPKHTSTQAMLAELYAQRDRGARPATIIPPAPAATRGPIVRADELLALDPLALAPGAPMDALPLRDVLGGHRAPAVEADAYVIELGDDDPPPPAPDLDFSGLLDDPPPAPPSPPKPPPRIPLFSSLAPDRLVRLIDRVALREVAPGATIVRQGDRGGSLFVIVRGSVEVTLDGTPPRPLAHLEAGAFFGELALLTDSPRSATVTAEEPTELLEISRELVSEIVADAPEVLKTLLRFFRDRMLDRLIGTSPLFSSLPVDDARALAARFKFLELPAGGRVIEEGQRAPGMFLLLCGEAEVARAGRTIARLGPGELFGEMSLLERGPAAAGVRTATKCWALELERADFQEIMLTYPQVLEYVSGLAAARGAARASEDKIEFL